MEEEYKQYKTRLAKTNALSLDIVAVWLIAVFILTLFYLKLISLPGFECNVPYFEPYTPDSDIESWEGLANQRCEFDFLFKAGGCVLLIYAIGAAISVSSYLKATPAQYVAGRFGLGYPTYFTNEKGEQPKLHEAIRLIMVSRNYFPWYLLFLYFMSQNFNTTLTTGGGAFWATLGLLFGLRLYDSLNRSELTWDEKFSGLRVHLTDKAQEKLDKDAQKLKKWRYRFYFRLERFGSKTQILEILVLAFFTLIAFNFIRDGAPPKEYEQVLYERPAPIWEGNAYFALAGLDAPREVDDFYEYGRQRILFHAQRWADYKRKIPVPYVHDVPHTQYNLFKAYEPIEKIEFDDNGIDDWDCLYNELANQNGLACPSLNDVLALREKNAVLWQRFIRLGDYKNFSIPDHFIDGTYSGQNLINLTNLHVVHLMDLQAQGQSAAAIEEWIRYMNIYKQMVHNHTTMVDKAIFLIVFKMHFSALENLLYNHPQLAFTHGEAIRQIINIGSVLYFQAGQMIADDWRIIGPSITPISGLSSNHKRELLSCFRKNQNFAELSPKEYDSRGKTRICETEFPEDLEQLMGEGFTESGFFISNIIFNLLIGGILKGEELIGAMHRNIADISMANAGMELIRRKVAPQDVQAALNNMPEDLQNPIAEEPFLWDEQNGWIYYPNPEDPMLQPSRVFRVNLSANQQ